ncbi:MAG: hypothetical protein HRT67_07430 [Flavobacteriaceae bacterium]|nr:hypothetical protein [Flavobacteriaceae bacterium]
MNRKYFYLLIIGLLLMSNFLTLFFVITKKHKRSDDVPKSIIIEKLNLDKQQIVDYELLIDQHKKDIKTKDNSIIQLKKELYSLLHNDSNKIHVDSLTSKIGSIQKQIETIHFNHFKDIKSICNSLQIKKFNELVDELERIFSNKKHREKIQFK